MSQAEKLTLASRAFSTDCLGEFALYMTAYFGYDRVLPMVRSGIRVLSSVLCAGGEKQGGNAYVFLRAHTHHVSCIIAAARRRRRRRGSLRSVCTYGTCLSHIENHFCCITVVVTGEPCLTLSLSVL